MKGVAAGRAYQVRWKGMHDFKSPPESATVTKFRAEKRGTLTRLRAYLRPFPRVHE
jgi:hypothetical protein